MTRLAEPPACERSSTPRWSFAFLAALAFFAIFAHGCHGDDIDHEPSVKCERQDY